MAQLVEHNLAKVGVAGSSPVVRSIVCARADSDRPFAYKAKWPSGKAEACKAFTPGSNPGFASIERKGRPERGAFFVPRPAGVSCVEPPSSIIDMGPSQHVGILRFRSGAPAFDLAASGEVVEGRKTAPRMAREIPAGGGRCVNSIAFCQARTA